MCQFMFANIGLIPPWLAAGRLGLQTVLARLVFGRRGLDHSQAPDCQIVDLDLTKTHFAEVGPQDRQPRDGKRADGQSSEGKRAHGKRTHSHRRYAHRRQFQLVSP
jgi:hypothetical protein